MKTRLLLFALVTFLLPLATLAEESKPSIPLKVLRGKEAPTITEVVKVLMLTDAGELVLEVYPQAAPNAAKRFLELVEAGYYDGTPIFRVVKQPEPFVAQFGINSDMADWKEINFDDDP
ncbi:MAG: peptidylprolyl isomerase, partial [Vulcanimicrobiota bacterium]